MVASQVTCSVVSSGMIQITITDILRVFSNRITIDDEGCYIFLGANRGGGYKGVSIRGHAYYAHRAMYSFVHNDLEMAGVVDHTCHTSACKEVLCKHRHCVNPDHLRLVTQKENLLSGNTLYARNARKTHCNSGHEFTEQNTYLTKRNQRLCKTCRKLGMRKARNK